MHGYAKINSFVISTRNETGTEAWSTRLLCQAKFIHTPGLNAYDYSAQYNYATKHNPMVFFTDTNGGCDTTTSNPLRTHYAPLQQLALDLQHDGVADYTWITPNQYNDMHTSLSNGYGKFPSSDDGAKIAQGGSSWMFPQKVWR